MVVWVTLIASLPIGRRFGVNRRAVLAGIAVLGVGGTGLLLTSAVASGLRAVPAPPQAAASIPDVDPHEALGSKSAPVVVEVFSDFQCPACKTLFLTTNRQLMDNYVSTGKVYLIHRDFPLPMHAHSKVAAQYCRAAAQLGKLEPVEEALFQNQEKWEQSGDVDGTVASVLTPAEINKVRALVKSGTLDAAIAKDQALGQTYRVSQTPTTIFHANGQTFPYAGVMNWEILRQFLDQLLSQR
jgi:protein-disulfide isomerase